MQKIKFTITLILMMTIGLLSTRQSKSQTNPISDYQAMFDNLDSKYFPSGILLNRSIFYMSYFNIDTTSFVWIVNDSISTNPFLYSIGNGYCPSVLNFDRPKFMTLYYELLNTAIHNNILRPDSVQLQNQEAQLNSCHYPISLMNVEFHNITNNAPQNGYLYFDTQFNKYTIMPDTLFIQDTLMTLIDNPDSLAYLAFEKNDLYAACALNPARYIKKTTVPGVYNNNGIVTNNMGWVVDFKLSSDLFITNKDLEKLPQVKIDFDDGLGFRNIEWDQIISTYYVNNFNKFVEKEIKVQFLDIVCDIPTTFKFNIVLVELIEPDEVIYADDLDFSCAVTDSNPIYTPGQAKVSIRYANSDDFRIRKPVILVEGFEGSLQDYGIINYEGVSAGYIEDSEQERAYEWLNELGLVYDSLSKNGYDIIHVDFKNSREYIQNNGLALVKIIQYVNAKLEENKSNEKLVVIGASMGGLISHYAIRMMELQDCCHNVRLWATFDTPHRGANISIGTQKLIERIAYGMNGLDIVKPQKKKKAKDSYEKVLCSDAAKQMLIYHNEMNAIANHLSFYNFLDNIGMPENCRKIAITNGSENAFGFQYMDSQKRLVGIDWHLNVPYEFNTSFYPKYNNPILKDKSLLTICAYSESNPYIYKNNAFSGAYSSWISAWGIGISTSISLWALDASSVVSLFTGNPIGVVGAQGVKFGIKSATNPILHTLYDIGQGNTTTYSNNLYSNVCLTEAPGSMSDTQGDLEGFPFKVHTKNHTFIPTASSLKIPLTHINSNIKNMYLADQSITPFDAYWACDRIPGYHTYYNMMHVQCNSDNREWITKQIYADWELKNPTNGEYHGSLSTYYNYGRPDENSNLRIIVINNPYQTILYSLDIENNGKLYVNKQDVIGLSTGTLYPKIGSKFTLKTNNEPCKSTEVRIKNGGQFIISHERNYADVFFGKNSILEIFDNGSLIVKEGGRLVMDEGSTLIIHPGAIILLEDTNSILELRGKVIIHDYATLEPLGDGFIRFAADMNANNINDYWDAGMNSKLILKDKNNNIKIKKAEILKNTYLPDNLEQIYKSSIIKLGENVTLHSYGSIEATNSIFTAIDSTKLYNAVKIYGQHSTSFGECEFKFGNYGLYAQMSYGGNTFQLNNCTFTKNKIGLYTSDQYIFINKCIFEKNQDYGWKAENMQSNCNVTESMFDYNGISGATFSGQGNVRLNVYLSQFRNNSQHGLEISEATLISSCSNYKSNFESGIYAKENATIDISSKRKNHITNNFIGILLNKAMLINIEHGYNNFSGNQWFIVGEVKPDYYYIGLNSTIPISLEYNLLPASSAMNMPINIYLHEPSYNNLITVSLINWTQNFSAFQTFCVQEAVAVNFPNYQMFEGKISTAVINTSRFNNTYLIDAFKTAAMQMSYGDIYLGNDTLAIALFKEIFDNIPPIVNDDELRAVDDALNQMISALTYAIEYELIDPNRALDGMPVDEYVGMIEEEINRRLNDIEYANMYAKEQEARFMLLLAQLYRAAEHYDYAIEILQNQDYFINTSIENLANYWLCVCNAENLLLKGEIDRSEFDSSIETCNEIISNKNANFNPIFETNSVSKNQTEIKLVAIYPNPAEQLIAIEFSDRIEKATIELSDLTGKIIWTTHIIVEGKQIRLKLPKLSSGTYLIKTTTENGVYNNKLIIK